MTYYYTPKYKKIYTIYYYSIRILTLIRPKIENRNI